MHMFIMNNHVSLLLQLSSILILFYILPAIHLSKFQTVRSSGQKPFFFVLAKWLCVKQGKYFKSGETNVPAFDIWTWMQAIRPACLEMCFLHTHIVSF